MLRTPRFRPAIALPLVMVALVSLPAVARAADPSAGGSTGSFHSNPTEPYNQIVSWTWSGSVPSYVQSAYIDTLETRWPSPGWNNSRAPIWDGPTAGAAARMYWDALADSPCNQSISLQWIQCTRNGGTTAANIHVRDLYTGAGQYSNWEWWNKTGSCHVSNCWLLQRAMIHEVGHAILVLADVDNIPQSVSVMSSSTPVYSATGGQRMYLQRCDQARAQLLWDVNDYAGKYANCYENIPGHGAEGLQTKLTVNATSYYGCNGQSVTVSGRLSVADYNAYEGMGNNPLTDRVVSLDRGSTQNYTSTTAWTSNSTNWSKAISGPANATTTWTAHYDSLATDDGLDSSPAKTFTVTFGNAC